MAASHQELQPDFAAFLDRDLQKDLLRFTTAGSVDDGKSTLIGRLLHDSKSVYEDQLAAVKKSRTLLPGEQTQNVKCRMRSLGCVPCTGAIRSEADTVPKIIEEMVSFRRSERENRVIDHDEEGSMELKKREGYF